MKSLATAAAVCVIALLPGCAKDAEGNRLGLVDQWKAMREKQDADARNFVDTEKDNRGESTALRAKLVETSEL